MFINILKSKIHGAIVTRAHLDYEGSITIDKDLLERGDMGVNEMVLVVNKSNGNRFWTYIFAGERGSHCIEVNGAAARLCMQGDELIIITHCWLEREKSRDYRPKVIFVDKNNEIDKEYNYQSSKESFEGSK